MSKSLSKEDLINDFSVSNVTEDGRIFVKGREISQTKDSRTCSNSYVRVGVNLYSNALWQKNKGTLNHKHTQYIPVARVMYAWFHGLIPEGMEVDHIDNNSLNNHISNLQLLTKSENSKKIRRNRNQYTISNLPKEEVNKIINERKELKETNRSLRIKIREIKENMIFYKSAVTFYLDNGKGNIADDLLKDYKKLFPEDPNLMLDKLRNQIKENISKIRALEKKLIGEN